MSLQEVTPSDEQPGEAYLPSASSGESITVKDMLASQSFRTYITATRILDDLANEERLDSSGGLNDLTIVQDLLTNAYEKSQIESNVTPSLPLQIAMTAALAPIRAQTGAIVASRGDERMRRAYESLFFPQAYQDLIVVGKETMRSVYKPMTENERQHYSGFAQEITFHLLHYRDLSAWRFTTPASVRDDFFRKGEKFDALAHNLKLGRERTTKVQIKRQLNRFALPNPHSDVRTIYGKQDMHNIADDPFWEDSLQADHEFPTLMALIDEHAGDTSSKMKLDAIAARLHSRLFS